MAGDSSDQEQEITRAFWAIELVPGKEYSTEVPMDLHLTSAVLPASAKDTGRSVVSLTFADENKTFSIVSLKLDHNESQSIDVIIDEGSQVKFSVSGKNSVHLSGYYVPDENPEGIYDDDDEIDSDEVGDDDEMGMEDSDDDVDADIDSATRAKVEALMAKKRKAAPQNGAEANKKPKADAPQQQQPKKENKPTPTKPQQQEAKKPQQQQQQQKPQQKAFPNGLKYTITKEGTGPEATKGKKVGVKYVGKLTKNNKVFDASRNKPFVFTLGAREVITGWDLGVAGMRVGEQRQLVIPPELGYGATGAGKDIPPNASLTFEVELLHVR